MGMKTKAVLQALSIRTSARLPDARILCLGEDRREVRSAERFLSSVGYRAVGFLPLAVLRDGSWRPGAVDLLVIDAPLPLASELLARSKAIDEDQRPSALVLVDPVDRLARRRALDAGARDVLLRPADAAELVARVGSVLGAHFLERAERRGLVRSPDAPEPAVVDELLRTQLELVRRLSRAGGARERETGNSLVRTSRAARRLALAVGCGEAFADELLHAAPMYDIGRCAIPDRILQSAEPLSSADRELVNAHTTAGAALLEGSKSPLLVLGRELALTHHEHWDGAGYPNGLRGEQIPISGRILAVADVFDALTSARVHRSARSVDDAVSYLLEKAGTQFDPLVVARFVDQLPAAVDDRSRFPDSVPRW